MAKITKDVELQPFRVPNYVIQQMPARPRQDGYQEAPKYHISELSEETLSALCDEFRAAVFAKAADGSSCRGCRKVIPKGATHCADCYI